MDVFRRRLVSTEQRLAAMEARVSADALSTAVEEAALRHVQRFADEASPASVDVEGVYRELDTVAEFVASRAALTAESLERLGPLEVSVLELRRDLRRAMNDTGVSQAMKEELLGLELRLQHVEASSQNLDGSTLLFRASFSLARAPNPPADMGDIG